MGKQLPTRQSEGSEAEQNSPAKRQGERRLTKPRNQRGQVLGNKGTRTKSAIMDAAREMIFERPFREISAVEISRRAGVAVATIYTYFEDVHAVIVALTESVAEEAPQVSHFLETPLTGQAAFGNIVGLITALVDYAVENYPIIRLRNHLADEGDDRLAKIRSDTAQPVIDLLARQIITHGRMSHVDATPHTLESAKLTAGLMVGMIDRLTVLLVQAPYRTRSFTKDDYIESAARIVLAAVTAWTPETTAV